jgi:4-coumarate--CoA ligase
MSRNGQEMPRAFVDKKDASVSAEELDSLIKSQFARHKWLTSEIYFIGTLPRTGIGKVMKKARPNPAESVSSKLKLLIIFYD